MWYKHIISATAFTSLLAKCIQDRSLSILLWEWGEDVLQGFGFGAPKSKFPLFPDNMVKQI